MKIRKFLVISTVALGIVAGQTSVNADNWKVYRNQDFGYEVKYPADWELIEAKPRISKEATWAVNILIDSEVQKVTFQEKKYNMWQGEFQIKVLQIPRSLTLEKWLEENEPLDPTGGSLVQEEFNIKVDGMPAKRLSIFGFDCEIIAIDLIYRGNVYDFTFTGNNPNDPEVKKHKEIYGRMLSSFRFIK